MSTSTSTIELEEKVIEKKITEAEIPNTNPKAPQKGANSFSQRVFTAPFSNQFFEFAKYFTVGEKNYDGAKQEIANILKSLKTDLFGYDTVNKKTNAEIETFFQRLINNEPAQIQTEIDKLNVKIDALNKLPKIAEDFKKLTKNEKQNLFDLLEKDIQTKFNDSKEDDFTRFTNFFGEQNKRLLNDKKIQENNLKEINQLNDDLKKSDRSGVIGVIKELWFTGTRVTAAGTDLFWACTTEGSKDLFNLFAKEENKYPNNDPTFTFFNIQIKNCLINAEYASKHLQNACRALLNTLKVIPGVLIPLFKLVYKLIAALLNLVAGIVSALVEVGIVNLALKEVISPMISGIYNGLTNSWSKFGFKAQSTYDGTILAELEKGNADSILKTKFTDKALENINEALTKINGKDVFLDENSINKCKEIINKNLKIKAVNHNRGVVNDLLIEHLVTALQEFDSAKFKDGEQALKEAKITFGNAIAKAYDATYKVINLKAEQEAKKEIAVEL